jgi:hypothetical protein
MFDIEFVKVSSLPEWHRLIATADIAVSTRE